MSVTMESIGNWAAAAPSPMVDARERSTATVVTVASATGGCGKTFFASNLAALLGRTNLRVLLVDLDLQFGEVAVALHLHPEYSLYDGLYSRGGSRLPDDVFEEHLDELVVRHELGFDVLTAPREPSLADYVGALDADHVLDVVTARYDVVVIDTPPSLNEVVLTALERSDVVAVMSSLDVPSLKNLRVFLDTMRKLKIDDSRIRLVLNKIDRDLGLDIKQVQQAFAGRFVGLIPQSRSVSRAMNVGTVVVRSEPHARVSRALVDAAGSVLPRDISGAAAVLNSDVRPGLWERVAGRLRKGVQQ